MKKEENKPNNFNEMWESWVKALDNIEDIIDIVYQKKKDYGYEIGFLYLSVNNTKVYAKLYINKENAEQLPLIAYYHGFGYDIESDYNIWLCEKWVKAGFHLIAMSARNQGNCSKDLHHYNYETYGVMCCDIDKIDTYYSKLVYQDAILLTMLPKKSKNVIFEKIKNSKIIAMGPSQGGILALVASTFGNIKLCLVDVPSGCGLKERVKGSFGMYAMVTRLINDYPEMESLVFSNLEYFDFINMASIFNVPLLAAVGTIDDVCPAELFMHAYEKINSPKQLIKYEGYGHGGFEELHFPIKLKYIKDNI